MIVRYIMIERREVVENLIFFLDLVGRRNMNFIRNEIEIIGSIKFII